MTDVKKDITVESWLRQLKWALASVAQPEREDIVREACAHIEEIVARGQSAAEALAEFGSPTEYARQFLDEMELSVALGSQRSATMLWAVGRRVNRSLVAAVAFLVTFLSAAAAFLALLIVILKISDPVHVGLWSGANSLFIGWIEDPSDAHELLGNWIYPLAALTIALAWLIVRFVLRFALRKILSAQVPNSVS